MSNKESPLLLLLGGLSGSFVKHAPQVCSVGGAALNRFKKRLAVSFVGVEAGA